MLIKINKLYILILLIIFTLLISPIQTLAKEKTPSVLFISSYNYDWESVPYQLRGFNNTIDESANIDYIFMDTKNISYENAEENLLELIKSNPLKYQQYDCVVAADDNALEFVMNYRDEFNNTSVVFLAINSIEKANEASLNDNVVGIIEKGYYKETIEIAQEIYSQATTVTAIIDNTNTGMGSKNQLELDLKDSDMLLNFINTSTLTKNEIIEELTKLDESTILIYLNFIEDIDGNSYTTNEAINLVNEFSSIPAFRTDYPGINYGFLGGEVIRFDYMGEQAAELVNKIILDEDITEISVLYSEGILVFNNDIIKKYNIEIPNYLLSKAEIINIEQPFYVVYSSQIIMFIILLFSVFIFWSSRKIRRKNVELSKANNIKLDFMTKMSHDMRTPISAVIGLANFGIEDNRDQKDVEYFKQIKYSSKYLLALINDILEMQRIEKQIQLYPTVTRQEDIVKDIVTIVTMRAREKNINFKYIIKNNYIKYHKVDSVRTIQILINILNNAIKYTPENGNVTWSVEYLFENNQNFVLNTITDDGVGMSDEFIEEIYKPFTQESNTESYNETGTGLGMAVTKSLVDLMMGDISVSSKINEGTTFKVKLPFDIPTEEEIEIFNKQKDEDIYLNDLNNKNVLLCEDSDINAKIVAKILESYGMKVEIAVDGKIGHQKFLKEKFDIVILDIRMPIINGIQLTKLIRKSNKTIPIIALSANSYPEDINNSLNAGMNAHLSKPVDKDELLLTIQRLLI